MVVVSNADVPDVDWGFGPVNLPPVYTDDTENDEQSMDVGESPEPLQATDVDGDTLTYTRVSGEMPNGLTLNPDGTFGGTTTTAGVFIINIDVCDPGGECTTTELTLRILEVDPGVPVLAFTGRTVRVLATWAVVFIFAGLMMLAGSAVLRRRREALIVESAPGRRHSQH
ncbi:MAG: hypothetical protein HKN94_01115 [Acidimicrobiales bacterium]|nr:hypothetical protein [Acidimicrobiales bacterium]RZV47562.1 MAG: hypothetical protein EX269_04450 [Acidimicrobiales bacterium]